MSTHFNIKQVAFVTISLLLLVFMARPALAARLNVEIRTFDGKCLDIPYSNSASGALITTYSCHGGTNQRWDILDTGQIRTRLPGRECIDVPYSNPANGNRITTYTCHGGNNQKWIVTANYEIRTRLNGSVCLDVPHAVTANGTAITTYSCHGLRHQQFVIGSSDLDSDGIVDDYEDYLLKTFAPRIWLHSAEQHLPANAGWFITRSELTFSHNNCNDHDIIGKFNITPRNLVSQQHFGNKIFCRHDSSNVWRSNGSKSSGQNGFFMDLDNPYRGGESNQAFWELYGHVFRTANQQIVVQYWQFYPYNKAGTPDFWDINHEGDWEYTSVTLNRDRSPIKVTFFRHGNARTVTPDKVEWIGNHHVTYSSKGSHAQYRKRLGSSDCQHDTSLELHQTVFDTCNRGRAWDSWRSRHGGVVNVGELRRPLNGQIWLEYSGLWGEIGDAASQVEFTSGPIGPAYKGGIWRY